MRTKEAKLKKRLMVVPLVFVLCFAFGCQQTEEVTEEPVVDVEADVQAIQSVIEESGRAWNEGDYEGFMEIIDEDAILLPPYAPPIRGIEKIRPVYKTEFDSFDFDVTITTEEIHVSGDLAFSLDIWKGSMIPKDGSEPIPFENKNLVIYKKQNDGSWKTLRAMFSSNTPPESE
jgi:uncharacterized protein (TIGR02246 family)